MQNKFNVIRISAFILVILLLGGMHKVNASHSMGADITYECLGGNTYKLRVKFYRDCIGIAAPPNININVKSVSCGQNFGITCNPIPGTGQEVSALCPTAVTTCNGGTYTGIQEWIYDGIVTLPMQCTDWTFSWTYCCRNAAITTINTPGANTFYIYATLDNTVVQCNNSPTFTNIPVPFACLGQQFQFNHGAVDVDGDSLVYSMVPPKQNASTDVSYISPYTAIDPLASTPALQFNSVNGDIIFNPTIMQVTVMAVLVKEYRNGILIGTVVRDIQVTIMNCNNSLPTLSGMNGSSVYDSTICANTPICFDIYSNDADAGQILQISWNNGIDSGAFNFSGTPHPTGHFCWTPSKDDISTAPHCFTVRVKDNACPYNGSQTYSYCITVRGVKVNAGPDLNIACSDVATITATVTSGTAPFTYLWSNGFTNPTQTVGVGTYIVTVTDANGCQDHDTVNVISAFEPVANWNYTGSCASGLIHFFDASTTPSGSISNWFWNFGDGSTSILQNPTHTYNTAGTYNVMLIIQNIFGCIDTLIKPVVIRPLPVPSFVVGGSCAGSATCFNSTSSPVGSIDSIFWNFGNGNTSLGNAPCTVFSNAGSYNVTLTIHDTLGCQNTLTLPVVIHPLPTAYFTHSIINCQNGAISFVDSSGNGVNSWYWNFGDGDTSTLHNPTHTYTSSGTFYPYLVLTNQFGCTDTFMSSITIHSSPFANAGPDVNVCLGSSVTLNAAGGVNYNWSPGGLTTGTITVSPTLSTSYSVVVTDVNGCSAVDTMRVTVLSLPVAVVSPDQTICNGGSATLSASGGVSYNWNPTGSTTGTITVIPSSNMTYAVDVIDANGCKATAFVNVTVHANPVINLPSGVFTCNGNSIILNPATTGSAYLWNNGATTQTISVSTQGVYTITVTNQYGCKASAATTLTVGGAVVNNTSNISICQGQSATINAGYAGSTYNWSNGATSQSITVSTAGPYMVTVTNPNGCSGIISTTVNVNPLPVADFTPNYACINQSVVFTNQSSVNGTNINTWNWNFGDGNVSQQQSPIHSYSSTGSFTASLTVVDNNGCTATMIKSLSVYPLPTANFNVSNGCQGSSILFNDLSAVSPGNITAWSWSFGDGAISSLQNPSHIYNSAGTYIVTLNAITAGGCSDSISKQVTIYPAPVALFTTSPVCKNSPVILSSTSTLNNGVITTYNWNLGNGQGSAVASPSVTYTSSGTFNVTLTVGSSNGCSSSVTHPITVNAVPLANAGNNIWICRGASANLTASGGGTYNWSPGGNTTQVINVNPNNTTVYYVTVTNSFGCTANDSVIVTIKNLPNADAGPDKTICAGGGTSLLAAGGTSYVWNPGGLTGNVINVSPAVTTQYTVTVTAVNGCKNTDTVKVNVNPLPLADAGPDQTLCSGFTATLTATGGTNYYWSHNGATTSTVYVSPAAQTNYTVVVTDSNGCKNSDSLTVNVNASPIVNLNTPGFFCAGYSTTLDAGNPGATYLWTPNGETTQTISVSVAGTYNVAVTNVAGCTTIGFSDIYEGGTGLITNAVNVQLCQGSSTVLSAGNPGATYLWSNGNTSQTILVNTSGVYNVTVSDSLGCSTQFSNNVIVHSLPDAGFTGGNVCLGTTVVFTDTTSQSSGTINSWNWNFGNGTLGNSSTYSVNYGSAGNYTVSLVVTSGFGCTDSVSRPITINPLPNVDFTVNNACLHDAVQFNDLSNVAPGTLTSWYWNFGDGSTSNLHNPSYTYAADGTYNVTLTATTAAGCSNTMINSVTINPKPVSAFIASEVCEGNSTLFQNTSYINNGGLSDYTWNFGDATGSTVIDPSHIYATAGTYNVTLTIGSDQGCVDTLSKQVVVNANPVADFSTSPVCGQTNMQFNDHSVVSGSTINGWSWSFGDSTISNSQNPSHIYNNPGNYLVNLSSVSAKGCSDSIQKSAMVYSAPVAGFKAVNACSGNAVQFTDTSMISSGTINSWQWVFGDGSTSNVQHPSHNYVAPGTYPVTLLITSANGCIDSITQNINVFPVPAVNFGASDVCANNLSIFTDQSLVTGGGTFDHSWNFGDGNIDTAANPSHMYATAGVYNVTLSVITPFGCSASTVKQVKVFDLPVAAFTTNNVCENVFAQLNDMSTVANGILSAWSWNLGDGTTIQAQNVNHLYPTAGFYNVTLNVTSINGCESSITDSIQIFAKPSPVIATQNACMNSLVTLSDTSTGPNNVITNWSWTFDNGTTSNIPNPIISFNNSGVHSVSLVTTNSFGCMSPGTATLQIFPLPVPGFTAGNSCSGSATQFDNTSNIAAGAIAGYTWHFGDSTSVSGVENPTHIYNQAGTYSVTLIVLSEFGCTDSIVEQIVVHPTPIAGFISNTVAGCGPLTVQFHDTSSVTPGTVVSWSWDFGDGQTSSLQNPSHSYLQSGSYSVSLTVTSDSGCSNFISVPNLVTVYPSPTADFTPDPSSQSILNPVFSFQNQSIGGQSYYWTFGNGNTSNAYEPSAQTYADTGNYMVSLVVINSFGCKDTVIKPIRVEPEFTVYIPNAFTPNNDGTNEGFNVKGWYIDYVKLDVYNRWGDLVFHSEGRNNDSWMGSVLNQSEPAPQGVYAYDIKVRDVWGRTHQSYGLVNLIR